jgi:predicted nucleic acid-binding Zn ribbon protein
LGSGDRRARATSIEEAASAVQRALLTCIGPGAAEQVALAQARLAWQEVAAEAGLSRGPMHSRLTRVSNGAARVEASDAMVAGELRLRADALAWAVNQRMQDRPGASLRITSLTIVVGREGRGGSL